jgi:hypothetical protein
MTDVNPDKLNAFVGKMLGDLGGAYSVPTTRLGYRLGLFDALQTKGPATAAQLAKNAGGLAERYVREWALAQAANGYIMYEAVSEKFSLSPEQAMVFYHKNSPVFLAGAFDLAAAMIEGEPKVERAFRDGKGVHWGDTASCLFCSVGAFFRPAKLSEVLGLDVNGVASRAGERRAEISIGTDDGDAKAVFGFLPAVGSNMFILILKLDGDAAPVDAEVSNATDDGRFHTRPSGLAVGVARSFRAAINVEGIVRITEVGLGFAVTWRPALVVTTRTWSPSERC